MSRVDCGTRRVCVCVCRVKRGNCGTEVRMCRLDYGTGVCVCGGYMEAKGWSMHSQSKEGLVEGSCEEGIQQILVDQGQA